MLDAANLCLCGDATAAVVAEEDTWFSVMINSSVSLFECIFCYVI